MLRPVRIRKYLTLMDTCGVARDRVLQGTGIEQAKLSDQDYLVSAAQCEAMIANMIALTGNPSVGFQAGGSTDVIGLGLVGGALLSCSVMRQTINIWHRYAVPLLGILTRVGVEEIDSERVAITVSGPKPGSPAHVFCVEEILSMTFSTGTMLSGMFPDILEVEFSYPAPPHRQQYEAFFNCPIRFDAERTRAVFAKRWVDMPLITDDIDFNRMCLEHCRNAMSRIANQGAMAARLRMLFRNNTHAIPQLEEAAHELKLSTRTLKRRLQEEGVNYKTLVRQFRLELASEYLGAGRMPAKKVADLLGFEDVHSFRRAFKTWTGATITEYRSVLMAGEMSAVRAA